MVERFHRDLKAAIRCHFDQRDWVYLLPTVLHGLRTCDRCDTDACPAVMIHENFLRVPGQFFILDREEPDHHRFLNVFRRYMYKVKPVPVSHHNSNRAFIFKDMANCSHVHLESTVRESKLDRPYKGSYKLI